MKTKNKKEVKIKKDKKEDELYLLKTKYNNLVTKHNKLCEEYNKIPKFVRKLF